MIKQNGVEGTYLLGDFGLMFQWDVNHSLSTCRRGGGHQVSQEWGARENYGMQAVCMLEDVLMFVFVKRSSGMFEELRRLTNTVSA